MQPFNTTKLFRTVLVDTATCVAWCQSKGLIPKEKLCEECGDLMRFRIVSANKLVFRCKKTALAYRHDKSISALQDTWFAGSKFGIDKILIMTYYFAVGTTSYNRLMAETADDNRGSGRNSISNWVMFCRDVCMLSLVVKYEENTMLGGNGMIVEIVASKITKRKINRARTQEGSWIVVMIECEADGPRRGSKHRVEVCPDAEVLLPFIRKHVLPGTTIGTDLWRPYFGLEGDGYYRFSFDRSGEFVYTNTGANSKAVESTWRHLVKKGGIRREHVIFHLCEYLYRRQIRLRGDDPFLKFVEDIASIY